MILVRFMLLLFLLTFMFMFGFFLSESKTFEDSRMCHEKYQVVSHKEMCDYYGFSSSERRGCRVKPRVAYAYTSHKIYACLYGKRGKAWGF